MAISGGKFGWGGALARPMAALDEIVTGKCVDRLISLSNVSIMKLLFIRGVWSRCSRAGGARAVGRTR